MLCLLLAAWLQAASGIANGAPVTLTAPQAIADLDLGKMKGDFARLAWSADGSELYVQTVERDRTGQPKAARHYLVSIASRSLEDTDREPAWAAQYWTWKSAQASPAAPSFAISVDGPRRETKRATAAPTGGVLARGGTADPSTGTTVADVASAADQTQVQVIYALKAKGWTLGEWVNEPVMPGVNFGWAPAPLRLLAFTKRDGGPIMVLDENGRAQELAGTKSALLPAWSGDGKRIAWLERKDRKKYQLTISEIVVP